MSKDTDELLAAYLDGVSELTTDERKRVEARLADDPELRDEADATRSLLGQLRELPPEGTEPDWRAMEQAIRAEVGDAAPRRRWWQSKTWTWLAPITALALAGAVLVLVLRTPDPTPVTPSLPDAGVARVTPPPPTAVEHETMPLWLDGAQVEVDVADADLLSDGELSADDAQVDAATPDLMGADDLAWVDELGEDDIAAAEAWLARKKS